jgi:GNAT superfamily N-acetyltransferase
MLIKYVQEIQGTNVLPFVIDSYVALREAGHIEAYDAPASGEEEAFYITNRLNKIVAVLSFFKSSSNTYTINMGFVLKPYRKKGYYRALWNRLVEEAKNKGIRKIIGYHKSTNAGILAFNDKVGRKIKYICTEYEI